MTRHAVTDAEGRETVIVDAGGPWMHGEWFNYGNPSHRLDRWGCFSFPRHIAVALHRALGEALGVMSAAEAMRKGFEIAKVALALNDSEVADKLVAAALAALEGAVKDSPDGFRTCAYCGCHTNAKFRACCAFGRDDDRAASALEGGK